MLRRPVGRPSLALIPALITWTACIDFVAAQSSSDDKIRQESADAYYTKWLDEDVVYLITPDERAVFQKLQTLDEKDQFIEQFWFRRDPDPQTVENQFKVEHYRRIAYANERYFSGVPGWKSDRGMIYIKYGEPDSKERQPYGGPYKRRGSEGGGETTAFPFERWWYAHIDGIGEDIEIEFVDRNFSNEYRLSINPNDKDSMFNTPAGGNTQAEFDGERSRFNRLSDPLGVNRSNPLVSRGDLPFERLRRWAAVQKAPVVKNVRLQEIVTTDVRYDQLRFDYRVDWLRAGDRALVPLTVSIDHKELRFGKDGLGGQARVNLFGRVKNLQGRIISVFEEEIVQTKGDEQAAVEGKSLFQKILLLESGRYRLDLVLEDVYGNKLGTLQKGFVIPRLDGQELKTSPVILVERVEPVGETPDPNASPEMFVLGNLRVLPRLGVVPADMRHLMFYFQLYNAGLDSSTLAPDLDLIYQLVDGEEVVAEKSDLGGTRASFVSDQRIVLLEYLDLRKVQSSSVTLRIQVNDKVSNQTLTVDEPIRIANASALSEK